MISEQCSLDRIDSHIHQHDRRIFIEMLGIVPLRFCFCLNILISWIGIGMNGSPKKINSLNFEMRSSEIEAIMKVVTNG